MYGWGLNQDTSYVLSSHGAEFCISPRISRHSPKDPEGFQSTAGMSRIPHVRLTVPGYLFWRAEWEVGSETHHSGLGTSGSNQLI